VNINTNYKADEADAPVAAEAGAASDDTGFLGQGLWSSLSNAASPEAYASAWLDIQCRMVADARAGVVVLATGETGPFAPVAYWPDESAVSPGLTSAAEHALAERKGAVRASTRDGDPEASDALAYPVVVDDQLHGVVAMEVGHRDDEALRATMRQLQWGCLGLEAMVRRKVFTSRDGLASVLDLVAISLEHPAFQAAATALVTELARLLSCEWVSIGFRRGRHTRVRAFSHSADFAEKANLIRGMGAAMDEAMDQQVAVVYPSPEGASPVANRAHMTLASVADAGALCTVPMSDGAELFGALTLSRPHGGTFSPADVELVRHVALLVGPVLEMKRREDRWLVSKAWDSWKLLLRHLLGPRHVGLKLSTLGVIALALFLALATGEYRVTANAALEGIVQRAVTAPMDGYIANAPARAGDVVHAGDVLCSLEDKDIRLERIKWVSQREQYRREYSKALAEKDRAQVRILGAQIDQADSQIALLDEQLARVNIVAPFDGVVVAGDLSQQLNAPVERGQVLFEVAPLDGYRVILKVDEREVSQVAPGQQGAVALTGLPGEPLPMVVQKVTPVATAEEGRNFFRVEATLEESPAVLRPGMEGVGKIDIEERKLAWIWTRELVNWLRIRIWSWWP